MCAAKPQAAPSPFAHSRLEPDHSTSPTASRWQPLRVAAGVLVSLFLAWQSVVAFNVLMEVRPKSWVLTAFVAWAFNMAVTGAFAIAGFVLPTYRLVPQGYYRVSRPELLRAIYQKLRVDLFRRALLATLWKDRSKRRRYFDGSASALGHLDTQSRLAEFGHTIPFVLLTAASCAWAFAGAVWLGAATLTFNVLGNLYPAVLQRHHRMRLQALRSRHRDRGPLMETVGGAP